MEKKKFEKPNNTVKRYGETFVAGSRTKISIKGLVGLKDDQIVSVTVPDSEVCAVLWDNTASGRLFLTNGDHYYDLRWTGRWNQNLPTDRGKLHERIAFDEKTRRNNLTLYHKLASKEAISYLFEQYLNQGILDEAR